MMRLGNACDWPYGIPAQTRIAKNIIRISKSFVGVSGKAWPLEYLKKAVATEKGEHHSDVNAQACENARTRHATSQSCGSWSGP